MSVCSGFGGGGAVALPWIPGGFLRGGRRPGRKERRRRDEPDRDAADPLAPAPDCSSGVIYAINMPVPKSKAMANSNADAGE
jgi:hypothetical protein